MNIRKDSGPVKWILIGVCTLFLFIMLILPLTYVMYTAFSKGIKVFLAAVNDKYALHSIKLTLEVSLIAVASNTFFGLFASWLITKFQFKGKKVISTLIDLPLTVSPIIAGLIYVLTFGRQSFLYPYLKAFGIKIIFAVPGIVLCTARAMGEFGAVSVLSGHLRGKTNTMPLYIELLYQGYDFTGAFAISAILVMMALVILVLRSVLEYKENKSRKAG